MIFWTQKPLKYLYNMHETENGDDTFCSARDIIDYDLNQWRFRWKLKDISPSICINVASTHTSPRTEMLLFIWYSGDKYTSIKIVNPKQLWHYRLSLSESQNMLWSINFVPRKVFSYSFLFSGFKVDVVAIWKPQVNVWNKKK